ncbi:AbrB/MazE/SpoVT family DNA-binding domain-containing protein [archaeon]|nr:AbrB/MazE/SpoVT family DNA-binding domain-containing protein [archaeon]MBL7057081.1 AbrB/MazE/SpoVT family DNA-binding domain-containing protein [Candidatus Woesearchaeota archaeon]
MKIGITKMSSKGQIVIPVDMRKDLKEGEQLIVMKSKGKLILKKASELDRQLVEDLDFAEQTEKAWREIEAGNFVRMNGDEFLEEIKKW